MAIIKIPIEKLEIDNEVFTRGEILIIKEIKKLLRQNSFIFVVADIGKPLRKIESEAIYEFWYRIEKISLRIF